MGKTSCPLPLVTISLRRTVRDPYPRSAGFDTDRENQGSRRWRSTRKQPPPFSPRTGEQMFVASVMLARFNFSVRMYTDKITHTHWLAAAKYYLHPDIFITLKCVKIHPYL